MELAASCFIQGAIKIYIMQRVRLFHKAKIQRQNNFSSILLLDTELLTKKSLWNGGGSCILCVFQHLCCCTRRNKKRGCKVPRRKVVCPLRWGCLGQAGMAPPAPLLLTPSPGSPHPSPLHPAASPISTRGAAGEVSIFPKSSPSSETPSPALVGITLVLQHYSAGSKNPSSMRYFLTAVTYSKREVFRRN